MIPKLIRAKLIARLDLGADEIAALDLVFSDCTSDQVSVAASMLPLSMTDLHRLYSEIESELRAERRRLLPQPKEITMPFILHRHFGRNQVIKEVEPSFFSKHGIQLSELAATADTLSLPPVVSLRTGMSPAKDQGPAGHCTSFAVAGCLDYFHGKLDLSEACLTHEAEKQYGDCSEGLAFAPAFNVSTANGLVAQSDWPNDPRQTCWVTPPNVAGKQRYKFAANRLVFYRPANAVLAVMDGQLRHGINSVYNPPDKYSLESFDDLNFPQPQNFVRLLKATLANAKTPVAVAVPVWWKSDGYFDAGWEDGPDIQMPTPVNLQNFLNNTSPPNVSGWHAVAVCGYDDSKGRFEFKNSWEGPFWSWGDNGFGTLPYDYITAYAREAMHGWV